jgi:nucleotide-binding universal stress UspA family protein
MADRTILIAVDAGVRTLDAVRLGELLARVSGLPTALATAFPHVPLGGAAEKDLREEARQTLLELGGTMDGVDVVDARVLDSHSPARALHDLSEEEHAALVVIGSTHRGAIGRVVPGTVAERLLSGAAAPVAVAPAGYAESERPPELRLVGVGYDGSDEARQALDGAAALARQAGARLRIITVFQRIAFGALATPGGVSLESVNDRLRQELKEQLDEAVAAQGDGVEGVFASGDAAEVLAAQSEELDLLVAGSRGYGPIGAVLLGGTTHRLLTGAACPLIVIPRGKPLNLAA